MIRIIPKWYNVVKVKWQNQGRGFGGISVTRATEAEGIISAATCDRA